VKRGVFLCFIRIFIRIFLISWQNQDFLTNKDFQTKKMHSIEEINIRVTFCANFCNKIFRVGCKRAHRKKKSLKYTQNAVSGTDIFPLTIITPRCIPCPPSTLVRNRAREIFFCRFARFFVVFFYSKL